MEILRSLGSSLFAIVVLSIAVWFITWPQRKIPKLKPAHGDVVRGSSRPSRWLVVGVIMMSLLLLPLTMLIFLLGFESASVMETFGAGLLVLLSALMPVVGILLFDEGWTVAWDMEGMNGCSRQSTLRPRKHHIKIAWNDAVRYGTYKSRSSFYLERSDGVRIIWHGWYVGADTIEATIRYHRPNLQFHPL